MNNLLFSVVLIIVSLAVIGCSQKSPEYKAIEMTKKSYALGGSLTVERTIQDWLKEKKDEVKPIGWEASRKNEQIYLVSYTFEIYSFTEGVGERGYFFEANIAAEVVHNITSEYERDRKHLSPAFKDEKELFEELLRKDEKGL